MRHLLTIAALALALSLIACTSDLLPTRPLKSTPPMLTEDDGYREFVLHGASYGANWDEVDDQECSGTYETWRDSVNWNDPPLDPPYDGPVWLYMGGTRKAGCVLGGGSAGDNYRGGTLRLVAEHERGSADAQIVADQQEYGYMNNVPVFYFRATTMYAYASAFSNFRFVKWIITRLDGSVYRDYHRDLVRPGDTDDYDYYVEFKVCNWNAWAGYCDADPYCHDPQGPVSCDAQFALWDPPQRDSERAIRLAAAPIQHTDGTRIRDPFGVRPNSQRALIAETVRSTHEAKSAHVRTRGFRDAVLWARPPQALVRLGMVGFSDD